MNKYVRPIISALCIMGCSPPYRAPVNPPQVNRTLSSTQNSLTGQQEIDICDNRLRETMENFRLKNPVPTAQTESEEDALFVREQSVCDRLRESYGLQTYGPQDSWDGNVPNQGYGPQYDHTARDMLTGAAIGAGATYLYNRHRNRKYAERQRQAGAVPYPATRYSNNQYPGNPYQRSGSAVEQQQRQDYSTYQKANPTVRKPGTYRRSRGLFRGRRR